MVPLTEQQIDVLFLFCRQHYIRYYDVQIELVDHLANAIEQQIHHRPGLGFEQALNEVYQGFGKTGFRNIIIAKEKSLEAAHRKYYFQAFRAYFTLPKILFTLFLLVIPFTIYHYFQTDAMLLGTFLFIVLWRSSFMRSVCPFTCIIVINDRHNRSSAESYGNPTILSAFSATLL
ncbi:hypothetical protein DBR32_05045 [Taibaiella sp. KBW10]|uniref:hypothetical protein n=1 Tax=Taibaiella sp. KBW10 TaxID=2153357 RepID=UPI000F5A51C0|nr:hypothetical protein [Taibaiella sp. KBW10]RQO31333.1 hypothetical protein DBR32_05045 [Taibaiella sp. KBW10]